MIKFRQKEYVIPAALLTVGRGALGTLNAAGNVAAIGGIAQGAQQMKQAEQQAEEQAAQNRKITKALNNIAENAKNNPQAAQQAADVIGQKQFARINLSAIKKTLGSIKNSKVGKNAIGFVKDVGEISGNGLIAGTLAGGTLAASSYLADKAVQHDMKKNGIQVQKNYTVAGSVMSGLKKAGKTTWKAAKDHKGMIASMAVLGAAPTALGYMAEKQQLKDQVSNTQQLKQKSYSLKVKRFSKLGFIKSAGKFFKHPLTTTKNWWAKQPLRNTPGETLLGFASTWTGGGGRKGVENFGKKLMNSKSGSEWSKKAGKFIVDHPKTALATSVPVGLGTMALTWDTGEKLVRKGAKAVDKNAYAYQESKEEQVQ